MQRKVRSALIVWAYFTAIGLSLFAYRYFEAVANRANTFALQAFVDEVLTAAWGAALLFPLISAAARRYPIHRETWVGALPVHAAALVTYSLLHTTLMWVARAALYPLLGFGSYDFGVIRARYPMEFFHDVLVYVVVVSVLWLFDRYVHAAQLEAQLAESRLENLRLQLQPHFLFNALNAISAAVYEDPRKADAMIAGLGNLLRSTISDSDALVVPLEREIETLELYLDIMRQRFEDRLKVNVHIAPEVQKALAPHLLLQPLVENSIRHGIDPASHSVNVTITAERDGNQTRVQVRDSGRGVPESGLKRGTGISNTAERLRQLYGSQHQLLFENCKDGGLRVTVAFPYRV